MAESDVSRRELLAAGGMGAMLVVSAPGAERGEDELAAFAVPLSKHEKLADVGGSATVRLPDGTDVIVARVAEDRFVACASRCTHNGCTVAYDHAGGKLVCPCHGSAFDLEGKVLTGPARRPLASFKTDTAVAVLYPKPD